MSEIYTSTIRMRMSASDAHYGGFLVHGAHMLSLFGDVATELAILCDGDEGLLVGYEKIEFLAPIYAGDFIEATGKIAEVGRTSRIIELEARRYIRSAKLAEQPSAADYVSEPEIVARATMVAVVPLECQRRED